jgi:hypothetical protein
MKSEWTMALRKETVDSVGSIISRGYEIIALSEEARNGSERFMKARDEVLVKRFEEATMSGKWDIQQASTTILAVHERWICRKNVNDDSILLVEVVSTANLRTALIIIRLDSINSVESSVREPTQMWLQLRNFLIQSLCLSFSTLMTGLLATCDRCNMQSVDTLCAACGVRGLCLTCCSAATRCSFCSSGTGEEVTELDKALALHVPKRLAFTTVIDWLTTTENVDLLDKIDESILRILPAALFHTISIDRLRWAEALKMKAALKFDIMVHKFIYDWWQSVFERLPKNPATGFRLFADKCIFFTHSAYFCGGD